MTKKEAIKEAREKSAEYKEKDDYVFVVDKGSEKFDFYHCEIFDGLDKVVSVWKSGKRTALPVWAKKMQVQATA